MYDITSSQITFTFERAALFDKVCNTSALNAKYVNEEVNIDSLVITADEKYFFDTNIEPIVASLASYFVRLITDKDGTYTLSNSSIVLSFAAAPLSDGCLTQVEVDILHSLVEEYITTELLRLWYHSIAPHELLASKYLGESARIDRDLRAILFQFYKPVQKESAFDCIKISGSDSTHNANDTYSPIDCSDPVEGSQLIMIFRMEPTGEVHLEDCDFEVQYYTTTIDKKHTISKSEMVRKNTDEYLAKVETDLTGPGLLKYVAIITMPNRDFAEDGTLKIIKNVCTSVNVRPMPK